MKLADIQPILTVKERDLLKRASHFHEDPEIYTNPERMRMITRLMKMGLLRRLREPNVHYEVTEKGETFIK
jgi:hypothetical protein